jgi:arginase family enzyme
MRECFFVPGPAAELVVQQLKLRYKENGPQGTDPKPLISRPSSGSLLITQALLPEALEGGVLTLSARIHAGTLDAKGCAYFGLRVGRAACQVYPMREISMEGLAEVTDAVMGYVRSWQGFSLVVFLDVLDPAFAPGLENPVPGGLSTSELLYVAHRLKHLQGCLGVQLVLGSAAELRTAQTAAAIAAELL